MLSYFAVSHKRLHALLRQRLSKKDFWIQFCASEDMRLRRRLPPPVAAPTCVRHDAMQRRMSECPIRSKDLLEIPKRSHKLSEQFQNVFRRCLVWQVVQTRISSKQSQKQQIPKNASEGGVTVPGHVSRLSHG